MEAGVAPIMKAETILPRKPLHFMVCMLASGFVGYSLGTNRTLHRQTSLALWPLPQSESDGTPVNIPSGMEGSAVEPTGMNDTIIQRGGGLSLETISVASASSLDPQQICHQNPYAKSLLPGHSFESAEEKANNWLGRFEEVKERLYNETHGIVSHAKFNGFEVMAPCHHTCTGACGDDESKYVCGSDDLSAGCIVYSIGGNNKWEFEVKMHEMTPCHIHTFDCTGPRERFQPPPEIADRHTFHHTCLSTVKEPAPINPQITNRFTIVGDMDTLQGMQDRLGHERLDLLKMDIEGYEWPLFESWPELSHGQASNTMANLPMQVLVEIHYKTQMTDLILPSVGERGKSGRWFKDEIDLVELQQHLLRTGYVVAHRDDNRMCRHCTELTLLRHKCTI